MVARNAALRTEPTSLADMHARKREIDRRQAEAAARLQAPAPATTTAAPSAPADPLPPPAAPETATTSDAPAARAIDPAVDAQIRATLGDTIDRTPRRIIARVAAESPAASSSCPSSSRSGSSRCWTRSCGGRRLGAWPRRRRPTTTTHPPGGGAEMSADVHHLSRDQVIALLEERDTLREQVRQLEEALVPAMVLPRAWRLSTTEEALLIAIRTVGPNVLHKERAMLALYGMWDDAPDQKIVDVLVCHIRRKLMEAQARVEIETVWGRGWRLSAEGCARFDQAVQADRAAWGAPLSPVPAPARSEPAAARFRPSWRDRLRYGRRKFG